MDCRRCGKELPVGQRKTCPHCGIYLDTIITPRSSGPKVKGPARRATIMTYLSVGLVVIIVCVLIPFLRSVTKKNMVVTIEKSFTELNGRN